MNPYRRERLGATLILVFLSLLSFTSSAEAALCPGNLTIITDSMVSNSTIRFRFLADGKSSLKNASIEYWVEDMTGAIVKERRETDNLGWKSYTPKTDSAYAIYLIKAQLTLNGCGPYYISEQYAVFKNPYQNSDTPTQKYICKPLKEGIALYLEHIPKTAIAGEEFRIIAGIDNHDNHTQKVKIYSYIYRASKTYSPSKTYNLKEIEILSGQSVELELANLANLTPGDYRLKLVAEYAPNKSKEVTAPITFASLGSETGKIRISYFGLSALSKSELTAEINSTLDEEALLKLVMESDTDITEAELSLPPMETAELRFPLKLPLSKNHLFLKLYRDNTLLGMSELVLENRSVDMVSEKPFTLMQGDIVLNTSGRAYSSSSAKSLALSPFILLATSIILNLYFIIFKKKS